MNEVNVDLLDRPTIGYVLEGRGEFECYLSLMTRSLGRQVYMQRQLAGSSGGIVTNLDSQLASLVLRYHPINIIVSLDLRDILRTGQVGTCAQLRDVLQARANTWLGNPGGDTRLPPMPRAISVIIQIQTFEAWFIANTAKLIDLGYVKPTAVQVREADTILNPYEWLQSNRGRLTYRKSPALQKRIISELDPGVMRQYSKSFDKLCRETENLAAD